MLLFAAGQSSFRQSYFYTITGRSFPSFETFTRCDQMLEQKVAQIVPKVAQILLRSYVFKIAQKVTKYLVRF